MKFSGRLQVEADPRNWLKADVTVAKGRLELSTGADLLGSWPTSQVTAERVEGDRFALNLGEDRAVFIADDALGFSYDALPHLNKKQLLPVGGVMEKIKHGLRPEEPDSGIPPLPDESSLGVETPAVATGKRLRELIREASFSDAEAGKKPSPLAGIFKKPAQAVVVEESGDWEDDSFDGQVFASAIPEDAFPDPAVREDALEVPSTASEPARVRPLVERVFAAIEMEALAQEAASTITEPAGELPFEQSMGPESTEPVLMGHESVAADPPADGSSDDPSWPNGSWPHDSSPSASWPTVEETDSDDSPLSDWPQGGWPEVTIERPSDGQPVVLEQSSNDDRLITALERIAGDVANGSLSPEQVEAFTNLVSAITEAVRPSSAS